jgi:class II lanthipeptide synthase
VNRYREQVAHALSVLTVRSPTSYAWFGRASRPLPRAVAPIVTPELAREHLLDRLEGELYNSFYVRGEPTPYHSSRFAAVRSDPAFVDTLSAANGGHGGWNSGWSVEAIETGHVRIARNGLHLCVPRSHCRPRDATPGAPVCVRRPKENRNLSPGFYLALGDVDHPDGADAVETRIYFHVTAPGAAPLVAAVTHLLNGTAVPFGFKVLNDRTAFTRCDAAVLYLPAGQFARARAALREIASTCAGYLRARAPALTLPLCHGVAVAEHVPEHGLSFGSSRCRLLAEGVVAAYERRAMELPARLEAVARCFTERGLDLDRPYLAPGSSEVYGL